MEKVKKLEANQSYVITHIGNNDELLFRDNENRRYFAGLLEKHISPIARIVDCKMRPKLLEIRVKIHPEDEIPERYRKRLHQPFSNLFNSYTKAFNKRYERSGSLFRVRFRREAVSDDLPEIL